MPVNSTPLTTYQFRTRVDGARAMYSGDYRKASNRNPLPCCTSGCRTAMIMTSPKYQYGRRLIDLSLGQLGCCNSIKCGSCGAGCNKTNCNNCGC
jgi:hypothetical protein